MKDGPSQCPRCGGELDHDREVERPVRVGDDVALVNVRADVCNRCGELLLHPGMVERLAAARKSLEEARADAPVVGRVYDYRSSVPG